MVILVNCRFLTPSLIPFSLSLHLSLFFFAFLSLFSLISSPQLLQHLYLSLSLPPIAQWVLCCLFFPLFIRESREMRVQSRERNTINFYHKGQGGFFYLTFFFASIHHFFYIIILMFIFSGFLEADPFLAGKVIFLIFLFCSCFSIRRSLNDNFFFCFFLFWVSSSPRILSFLVCH